MKNTVTIYQPSGEVLKVIHDPETYDFDESGVLVVNYRPDPNNPTQFSILRTTLPYIIESAQ